MMEMVEIIHKSPIVCSRERTPSHSNPANPTYLAAPTTLQQSSIEAAGLQPPHNAVQGWYPARTLSSGGRESGLACPSKGSHDCAVVSPSLTGLSKEAIRTGRGKHRHLGAPRSTKSRRGIVVVLVALGLVGLFGVVALTMDGGMLQMDHRKARTTPTPPPWPPPASSIATIRPIRAKTSAAWPRRMPSISRPRTAAADDGVAGKITVSIPPISGPYKGLNGYVEVNLTYYASRAFSRIFGSGTIPIQARAVARGTWIAPKVGVLILDYDDKASLNAQGNGDFTETGVRSSSIPTTPRPPSRRATAPSRARSFTSPAASASAARAVWSRRRRPIRSSPARTPRPTRSLTCRRRPNPPTAP